ncbi:MAG: protein translocase subunit SecD [Kiritimatiellia bacterium]|jgi:SecD/SecF fusion protein
MHSVNWLKWIFLVILICASVLLIIPPEKKIRLGLDLQGGYSFTLELDKEALEETIRGRFPEGTPDAEIQTRIKEAMASADDTALEVIRNRIDALGTEEPVITRGKDGRIYVQIPGADEKKRIEAENMIRSVAFLDFRLVSSRSAEMVNRLLDQGKAPEGYTISLIDGQKYFARIPNTPEPSPSVLQAFGNPDPGYILMLERVKVGNAEVFLPHYVSRRPLLTGEFVRKAGSEVDMITGRHYVTLSFNAEGAKKFEEVTGKYCPYGTSNKTNARGRQLAVALDGVIYSAPEIKDRIPGGNATITGNFTAGEARQLANVLNAGALPAPMKFIGKRFVNPTLGEDAIAGAKKAIIVGFAAVILFVILYYHYMGVVAAGALILNLVLLPLCAVLASNILSIFVPDVTLSGSSVLRLPVLTLPGIAGILLSIGMAVDANVLIYERAREEQQAGRPPYPSIMAGYKRAFLAIFDGNLTTVITAVILFIFGTGLIRGFSITLVAGIMASMYTALVVTKMVFQATVPETRTKPMTMMKLLSDQRTFAFNRCFKPVTILCCAVIAVTLSITAVRGFRNPASIFGVDFTGGAKVSYTVQIPEGGDLGTTLGDIRSAASAAGITDAAPQFQQSDEQTFLEIKTVFTEIDGREISEVLTEALTTAEALKDVEFTYTDIDSVGPQIGDEMKKSAVIAIILSTIAMLLYITMRFEFGFSLGAIAAITSDVLVTIGVFSCLGFQFDLTIVAAMLTIVGYGVNDTIVLFDRIREELKRNQKTSFPELANHCINLTLSRTILTSVSTLLTVFALMVFTSGDIFGFAVCMFIGLVASTFSTIFISTPVMLAWYQNKRPSFSTGK